MDRTAKEHHGLQRSSSAPWLPEIWKGPDAEAISQKAANGCVAKVSPCKKTKSPKDSCQSGKGQSDGVNMESICSDQEGCASEEGVSVPQASTSTPPAEKQANNKKQRSAVRQEKEANARSAFEGTGCVSNALEIESEHDGDSGGEDDISFGSSVDADEFLAKLDDESKDPESSHCKESTASDSSSSSSLAKLDEQSVGPEISDCKESIASDSSSSSSPSSQEQAVEIAAVDDQEPEQSAAGPRDARGGRARQHQLAEQERASRESGGTAPPPVRPRWTVSTVARCVLEWTVLIGIVVFLGNTWVGSSRDVSPALATGTRASAAPTPEESIIGVHPPTKSSSGPPHDRNDRGFMNMGWWNPLSGSSDDNKSDGNAVETGGEHTVSPNTASTTATTTAGVEGGSRVVKSMWDRLLATASATTTTTITPGHKSDGNANKNTRDQLSLPTAPSESKDEGWFGGVDWACGVGWCRSGGDSGGGDNGGGVGDGGGSDGGGGGDGGVGAKGGGFWGQSSGRGPNEDAAAAKSISKGAGGGEQQQHQVEDMGGGRAEGLRKRWNEFGAVFTDAVDGHWV